MNPVKINAVKIVANVSLIVLLFLTACGPSGGDNNSHTEKDRKAKSQVDKPKTDLMTAIISDDLEIVKQHIEAGTDINVKDQLSGSTPLITAATFGKTAIARALVDANADLDIKNNEGSTALHAAAFFCRIEIVQLLKDAGADKTIRNNFGATPRDAVTGPFAEMKPVYEMMEQQMGPLGLKLDMEEMEKNRPVIAMMLQ